MIRLLCGEWVDVDVGDGVWGVYVGLRGRLVLFYFNRKQSLQKYKLKISSSRLDAGTKRYSNCLIEQT